MIRLAWWRERLEDLDSGLLPAEPRLQAAAREILGRGIAGHELAGLEGGWRRLFDPFPWDIATAEAIWFRGRLLFGLAARLLGTGGGSTIEAAGGSWALTDAARHCSDAASRKLLLREARTLSQALGGARLEAALRPLSMLAALSMRDSAGGEPLGPEGTAARAAAMLKHRLTGRLPRMD